MFFLTGFTCAHGQSIIGKWKTIDDETGQAKSIIELFEEGGKISGRISKLFLNQNDNPNPVCSKCSTKDERYNKPIIGMIILQNLVKNGHESFSILKMARHTPARFGWKMAI
jgi:hypothetical protein